MAEDKYLSLLERLKEIGPCTVALSGGADSAFLLHAAREALGKKVTAVSVAFPYTLSRDRNGAEQLARFLGIRQKRISLPMPEFMARNPENRCYLCKKAMMTSIKDFSLSEGLTAVLDGTNGDDDEARRPGMKALRELSIRSPLRECAIGKTAVRRSLSELGLDVLVRQSDTCLLTRLPRDTEVHIEELKKIEAAEDLLLSLGFRDVRVRRHGTLARIEVRREDRTRLFSAPAEDALAGILKESGFDRITVDVEGYREK